LVAYSVYVAVAAGFTVTLVRCTALGLGETITESAPGVFHDSVTLPPETTCAAEAVKLPIAGADPVA
jgi:hypothetical protein